MSTQQVLFDAPGPKARIRHAVYTALTVVAFLCVLAVVYLGFNRTLGEGAPSPLSADAWRINPDGQWAAARWQPFLDPATWTDYVLPGLQNTLTAALTASCLALLFGLVFGIARLSDHAWIRIPAGAVVEFFRGIPLLMLIFFTMALPLAVNQLLPAFGLPPLTPGTFQVSALAAVVTGLTLYNGSVLAEVFRAGINAVPKGQAEAAYSLGMNKSKVMRLILIPQAVSSMMPAIVAQLVILLKDSALGYIVAFPELLRSFSLIGTRYGNVIPAAIICAAIYIAINISLSRLAIWLERRNARSGAQRGAAPPTAALTAPGNPGAPGSPA
ncbi:amino acid ABC transporter permease [Thermobifida cellulosilytica]|jgi:amine acid ABC transporter, permease protein, 3-TM region, His/Glu/Gln/Arg/opine family|uniref:Amino acid ABC transporter permease n=1 Tax=Thermobifida cellulosilytica TB100 TaxID=665004 RepID=A0A147KMJ8_THECS|nr:amino acid ABC transporter permease [Thermobifida cellulosilytica]KUP98458.1 amino acid ABC transporter permease [Thermobifida cellulosilytica TB100]